MTWPERPKRLNHLQFNANANASFCSFLRGFHGPEFFFPLCSLILYYHYFFLSPITRLVFCSQSAHVYCMLGVASLSHAACCLVAIILARRH
jgi:hypothetical protein